MLGFFHYFNSTMVRLKAIMVLRLYPLLCYFNSTMVRLKAARKATRYEHQIFQFHYGTIKSYHGIQHRRNSHISIPLWYD